MVLFLLQGVQLVLLTLVILQVLWMRGRLGMPQPTRWLLVTIGALIGMELVEWFVGSRS